MSTTTTTAPATGEILIVSARITAMPKKLFDPMPVVYVTDTAGVESQLFSYYPDEISFTESEFVGLTLKQASRLKFTKDRAYLRS